MGSCVEIAANYLQWFKVLQNCLPVLSLSLVSFLYATQPDVQHYKEPHTKS